MIGLLINTLPVAVTVDDDRPIADALTDLAARKATVLDHQHLSLTDIATAAGLGELFDTLVVVYESHPVDAEGPPQRAISSASRSPTCGPQMPRTIRCRWWSHPPPATAGPNWT